MSYTDITSDNVEVFKAVMKKNKAKWIVPFPKISINL